MKPCKSYSYRYALGIYTKFREKYTRATKIFTLMTNCRPDYPAWLFAHDQPKWNRYKKIIKIIQSIDLDCQPCGLSKHLLSYIEDELHDLGYFVTYTGLTREKKSR